MNFKVMIMKKIFFFIMCVFISVSLYAQGAIVVAGGDTQSSEGAASYTVGQVVYTSSEGSGGYVAQGIQQFYEIFTVANKDEAEGVNLSVEAYPNPAVSYIMLNVIDMELSDLKYQVYDINGNLLRNEKITNNPSRIVMDDLTPSTYFVKITRDDKELKLFKIIKR